MPRNADGTWIPGSSPNPGGRPRGVERRLRDAWDSLAKKSGHESGIEEWVGVVHGIMTDSDGARKDRLTAAKLLKEATYGMAKQKLELEEVNREADVDLSLIPLARRVEILGALKEVEQLAAAAAADESVEH